VIVVVIVDAVELVVGLVVEVVEEEVVLDGFTVDEVEELELVELLLVEEEVEPRFVPSSGGYGNGHEDFPFVATVMYLRQIVAGNEPPVTDIPCTDFINVPSG
jgi:hypothetical protein